MSVPLNFYGDVSGQPTGEISIGISSINVSKMSPFLKELKKQHPEFLRSRQKSTRFKQNKLKSLVNYFNGQKIHMCCITFKSSNWPKFNQLRQKKQYWKEIIYAVLYFCGLKRFSKKDKSYQVIICSETYLDIEKVKNYIKKLGKAHKYFYQVSNSYASQSEMIKISDVIAASGKRLNHNYLQELDNYELIVPTMQEINYYLKILL